MSTTLEAENTAKTMAQIAEQNDRFRTTLGTDAALKGTTVFTQGVATLPEVSRTAVLQQVQTFSTFDAENDPYGDHTFGAFDLMVDGANTKFFWKIDLYDAAYEHASPDPARPHVTRRVLTVMLASEY